MGELDVCAPIAFACCFGFPVVTVPGISFGGSPRVDDINLHYP